MDGQVTDRRSEARLPAAAFQIDQATLRPGFPLRVLDVSARGAQVESERPLRPARRVHLRLVCTGATIVVSGVVLRCAVWAVDRDAGVIYRSGVHFDHPLTRVEEPRASSGACG